MKLTENFNLEEFACKHCGKVELAYVIPYFLQKVRDKVGEAIFIVSGYRCPEHNRAVGGVADSLHKTGRAVDIRAQGIIPEKLAKIAYEEGFCTVIIYDTFCHCQFQGRLGMGIFRNIKGSKEVR